MNGIYPDSRRGTYRVYVHAHGRRKFLGSFGTPKEAEVARAKHEQKRGHRIRKNFPMSEGAQAKIEWLVVRFPARIVDDIVEEAISIAKRQRKSLQVVHIDKAMTRHNELLGYYDSDSE